MLITRATMCALHEVLCAAYPNEGCGFLLGTKVPGSDACVSRHIRVDNRRDADGAARNRYLIGPEDFLAAERAAATSGTEVVGTYHSHPDAPAKPSEYDRDHAWPCYYYLITSVLNGHVDDTRVWTLNDDRTGFAEHPLNIEEIRPWPW